MLDYDETSIFHLKEPVQITYLFLSASRLQKKKNGAHVTSTWLQITNGKVKKTKIIDGSCQFYRGAANLNFKMCWVEKLDKLLVKIVTLQ